MSTPGNEGKLWAMPYTRDFADILSSNSLVLDFGANQGDAGNFLSEQGHRVVSVDTNESACQRGRAITSTIGDLITRHSFVCSDMLSPTFPNETFDAVMSTIALQEITPKERSLAALRNIMALTRPGGLNLVRVYIGTAEQQADKSDRYTLYSPDELEQIYRSHSWAFVRHPTRTPDEALQLSDTGSVTSFAQILALKPSL